MGYNNSRTIVLDVGFRQYASTDEMLQDFAVTGGTPRLSINPPSSIHPSQCMEFQDASGDVGASYALTSPLAEPADFFHPEDLDTYETSVWVQMDATLTGTLQIGGSGGYGATSTYTMPTDGSWVEIGHTYIENAIDGTRTNLSVKLLGASGSGSFRIGRILVRRIKNHWTADLLSNGVVLPFLSDSDKLSFSWMTRIIECYNGAEVRTQHRLVPRGTLVTEFLLLDEDESALMESLLYDSAGKLFFVPFWPDAIEMELVSGTPPDEVLLDINKMVSRLFMVGGAVMFWNSPFDYSVQYIQTTSGDDDALAAGWFDGYPAGTICVPLLSGYLTPTANLTLPTPEDRKLTATFNVNLLGGSGGIIPAIVSTGGGGSPPPAPPPMTTCVAIWDEPFDQANIAAFLTQYNTNSSFGYDPDDVTNGWHVLSGGTMQLNEGGVGSIDFGPDAFTPVRECWLRVMFSVTGGDFPITGAHPCRFWLWGDDTAFDNYCEWASSYYSGPTVDETYSNTADGTVQDTHYTAFPIYLSAGTYVFYYCISEPTAGVLQSEIWVNPTVGDAADSVATSGRNGTGTISRVTVEFNPPTVTSNVSGPRAVIADRVTLYDCPRASDPFGILGAGGGVGGGGGSADFVATISLPALRSSAIASIGASSGGGHFANMASSLPTLRASAAATVTGVVSGPRVAVSASSLPALRSTAAATAPVVVPPPPAPTPTGFAAIASGIRPRGFAQGTYALLSPTGTGQNWYVATTGSDTNNGTSVGTPFRTIAKAGTVVHAGDVVNIANGTYTGSVVVMNTGTSANRIVFQATNRGGVILTGGGNYSFGPLAWSGGTQETGQLYVTVRGLTFRAYAQNAITAPGPNKPVAVKCSRGWKVEDCLFDNAGATAVQIFGSYVTVVKTTLQYTYLNALNAWAKSTLVSPTDPGYTPLDGVQVIDCILRGNYTLNTSQPGATADYVAKFLVTRGCLIDNMESYENNGGGFWFDTGSSDFTVRNSYFHHNRNIAGTTGTGRGLNIEANWAPALLENNVFESNAMNGIDITASQGITIRNNLLVANGRCMTMTADSSRATTFPLKDITITNNSLKSWTDFSAIHTQGGPFGTPAAMGILADYNTYNPSVQARLAWWNDGVIKSGMSIAELRTKFGWEAHGAIGTIVWP